MTSPDLLFKAIVEIRLLWKAMNAQAAVQRRFSLMNQDSLGKLR